MHRKPSATPTATATVAPTAPTATPAATATPIAGYRISTAFIILMENHDWSQIKGSASEPYINNTLLPIASHAEQ